MRVPRSSMKVESVLLRNHPLTLPVRLLSFRTVYNWLRKPPQRLRETTLNVQSAKPRWTTGPSLLHF